MAQFLAFINGVIRRKKCSIFCKIKKIKKSLKKFCSYKKVCYLCSVNKNKQ